MSPRSDVSSGGRHRAKLTAFLDAHPQAQRFAAFPRDRGVAIFTTARDATSGRSARRALLERTRGRPWGAHPPKAITSLSYYAGGSIAFTSLLVSCSASP